MCANYHQSYATVLGVHPALHERITFIKGNITVVEGIYLTGLRYRNFPGVFHSVRVDDDVLYAFRHFLRARGCGKKGNCRIEDCTWGHVCSRSACAGDSQSRREGSCCLTRHAHEMDCKASHWIPADRSAADTFENMAKARDEEYAASRAAASNKTR